MSVSASSKLEDESALAVVARGMRVLIYSASFFKIDGVTMTLRGLIDHIVTRGGRVLVLTADRPSDEAVDEFCGKRDAIEVLQATGGLVPVPGADYFMGLHVNEKTKRALECFDPGVVHITNPDLVTLWLANWVRRERSNCVLLATIHTNFAELASFYFVAGKSQALWVASTFLRHLYSLCPAVYAPTEFMAHKLAANGWNTKVGVWGRGVDADLFSPQHASEDVRRGLGLRSNDLAVLWVGRVVLEKRPGVWLKAIQTIQREVAAQREASQEGEGSSSLPSRIVGVCVGQGEAMDVLDGVKGVTCVGWKTGADLARTIASCDIMVSTSEIETFGRVTLEAMSCGLPCIVNRECGGHLIKDGVNGLTVVADDDDGYVTALRKLVGNAELRRKMSSEGRRIAQGYGEAEVYEKMLGIYRSLKESQGHNAQEHLEQKRGWLFWEACGLVVYFLFELTKAVHALIALITEGPKSPVVRLAATAFRRHLSLLYSVISRDFYDAPKPMLPHRGARSQSLDVRGYDRTRLRVTPAILCAVVVFIAVLTIISGVAVSIVLSNRHGKTDLCL